MNRFPIFGFVPIRPLGKWVKGTSYRDVSRGWPRSARLWRRRAETGICGSGVGASVVANKVAGVWACLIHEAFSAHQGVEDDGLDMICLGGLVVGHALAWELVNTFLAAEFSGAQRHRRRLAKVTEVERKETRS